MNISNTIVFAPFEDGLELLLELLKSSHLVRFALVPTAFQFLHLFNYFSGSSLLEKLSVVTVHLFLEF
jgi:hypothetical protein